VSFVVGFQLAELRKISKAQKILAHVDDELKTAVSIREEAQKQLEELLELKRRYMN
jgi:hypothetical protein